MLSRSVVSDSATPQTVTHQAPLSMEFSRQEYWSGLPLPTPDKVLALLLNGDIMQVIYQYKHQNHPTCLLKMMISELHSTHAKSKSLEDGPRNILMQEAQKSIIILTLSSTYRTSQSSENFFLGINSCSLCMTLSFCEVRPPG